MSEYEQVIDEIVKHGVVVKVDKIVDDNYVTGERRYVGCVVKLDFTEHDKVFEDRIAKKLELIDKLYKENVRLEEKCMKKDADIHNLQCENRALEKRIAELEDKIGDRDEINRCLREQIVELQSKETENPTKINLNDRIKVKLTPLGAEIYYHQYDELNKKIKANGGTQLEPIMPEIDKDGYTEFTFHHFISLYGNHIGMCKPNVIEPLDIVFVNKG